VRLPFQGPLDWEALRAYFAARAIPGVEVVTASAYRRTIVAGGEPGVLELSPGGEDHLVLHVHGPEGVEPAAFALRARRIMGLDLDLEEATRHLAGDPVVGPLVEARPGLRVPGTWDPFETGVRAIVGQQVTVAGAGTITGRLVERLGTPAPGLEPPELGHTFPAPDTVAGAGLEGLGLTRARERAIRSFARAVADGAIPVDGSAGLDPLVASIVAVDGLGEWTAHYLALRLGEPDAFPAGDLGLRRAAARHAPGSKETLAELAERWRPWRALAATHLWLADAPPPATPRRTTDN
jgi:AraC family transcriptional regulator, regulatory protein of adaptative response / DNA-3-methyladenine glycosylase II